MIAELVNLSSKGSMAGVETDYSIVKDYAKKYNLDEIDTLRLVKYIVSEAYSG